MMRVLMAIARNLRTFAIYVLVFGTVGFLGVDRAGFTYLDALTAAAYLMGLLILGFATLKWIALVLTMGPVAGTKQFAAGCIEQIVPEDN